MPRTTPLAIALLVCFAAACGGGSEETTQATSRASTLPQGSEPITLDPDEFTSESPTAPSTTCS
jgi:hypothetical protein